MKIKIGKILKAQGIKGEVKASCLLDDSQMLKHVKKMYVNDVPRTVLQLRCDGNFFFVRFAEIQDRNAAENLRDWELYCDKEDVHLDSERYFVDDIIGCRVVLDNGKSIGEVVDVLQYGAADVYVCKNGDKEISFPFLKDLAISVNISAKSIVLYAKRFKEVALYED